MKKIEWKKCSFNSNYDVSSHGFVRNSKTGRILKLHLLKQKYFRVTLSCDRKQKSYLVSRMVLFTFKGPSIDPRKNQAAHLNSNSFDNRIDNLAWKDQYGNFEDKVRNNASNAKLTKDDVFLLRNYYANGISQTVLAKRFGITKSAINMIVKGHRWKRYKRYDSNNPN